MKVIQRTFHWLVEISLLRYCPVSTSFRGTSNRRLFSSLASLWTTHIWNTAESTSVRKVNKRVDDYNTAQWRLQVVSKCVHLCICVCDIRFSQAYTMCVTKCISFHGVLLCVAKFGLDSKEINEKRRESSISNLSLGRCLFSTVFSHLITPPTRERTKWDSFIGC